VLRNLDNYLEKWGHYGTLVGLHGRIHGRIATPAMNASHLSNLGLCHHSLGEYRRAIDLYTEALAIARETGYRQSESARLGNLGLCYYNLGEYQRAIDLCTQALAIAREIGYRQVEANALGNIGRAWLASGDTNQAAAMLAQAVSIADTIGAVEPALEARSWLAWAHLQLGDAAAALAVTTVERELTFLPEEPAMHMFQGLALLELDRLDESVQALTEALAAADGLLALADRNVAALGARALALSCLAVVTSDQARAAEAAEAFARARAVTRAPGVVADTRRLLGIITAHDHAGLLTATGCGSEW
jgi:tetratricopeptide (TPR) repeat protein